MMQIQGKRMRFFYNDDAEEAMRKRTIVVIGVTRQRASVPYRQAVRSPQKRNVQGEKRSYEGANSEIYETTLETSMKLIQFLERSSSQKSRKLTSGKRDSILLFGLTPDDDFFDGGAASDDESVKGKKESGVASDNKGVKGVKESTDLTRSVLGTFELGYALSSSSDISMKLRTTQGLLRSAEGFRPSRRASAAEWLPARCRVETERDLRDDRLILSWTSDGDDMGTIESLSN
jgi:hypothetical protein